MNNIGAEKKAKRWKSICMSFLVVYPTLQLLTHFVSPRLSWLPPWIRDAVLVILICTVISYALPVLSQRLSRWLLKP